MNRWERKINGEERVERHMKWRRGGRELEWVAEGKREGNGKDCVRKLSI